MLFFVSWPWVAQGLNYSLNLSRLLTLQNSCFNSLFLSCLFKFNACLSLTLLLLLLHLPSYKKISQEFRISHLIRFLLLKWAGICLQVILSLSSRVLEWMSWVCLACQVIVGWGIMTPGRLRLIQPLPIVIINTRWGQPDSLL